MLEDKILELSKDQKASLPKIIARAKEKNFPGITFTNKSASFFISDCVDIANDYIPLTIYGTIKDPISMLKGKVTKAEIEDFIKRSNKFYTSTLLYVMLEDIKKTGVKVENEKPEVEAVDDIDNVYGVYGEITERGSSDIVVEEQPHESYSTDNLESIKELLIKVLEAK